MIETHKSDTTSWGSSLWRGFRRQCPHCGQGKLFTSFLKLANQCDSCGLEVGQMYNADDGPAFFTMSLVLFILAPILLWIDVTYNPSVSVLFLIFLPLVILTTVLLLPLVKGAFVAASWKATPENKES